VLQPVIDQLISESEAKMPTIPSELESGNYAKQVGWGGLLLGAAAGAKLGAGIGIAGGPLGAIAGTIPGAIVGGVVGFFSGEKVGANFEVDEPD
jgi:phage tail tape-measure protein